MQQDFDWQKITAEELLHRVPQEESDEWEYKDSRQALRSSDQRPNGPVRIVIRRAPVFPLGSRCQRQDLVRSDEMWHVAGGAMGKEQTNPADSSALPFGTGKATVWTVFIASPSDVKKDKPVVADAIGELNAVLPSEQLQVTTKSYEWATTLQTGVEGQAWINKKTVRDCHILIALFGKELGSPVEGGESGTISEINTFLELNKGAHAIVLFKACEGRTLALTEWKRRISGRCLYGTYKTADNLKAVVKHQLFARVVETVTASKEKRRSLADKSFGLLSGTVVGGAMAMSLSGGFWSMPVGSQMNRGSATPMRSEKELVEALTKATSEANAKVEALEAEQRRMRVQYDVLVGERGVLKAKLFTMEFANRMYGASLPDVSIPREAYVIELSDLRILATTDAAAHEFRTTCHISGKFDLQHLSPQKSRQEPMRVNQPLRLTGWVDFNIKGERFEIGSDVAALEGDYPIPSADRDAIVRSIKVELEKVAMREFRTTLQEVRP